jgi:hypothetical protein
LAYRRGTWCLLFYDGHEAHLLFAPEKTLSSKVVSKPALYSEGKPYLPRLFSIQASSKR